jgi:hypothetical protein
LKNEKEKKMPKKISVPKKDGSVSSGQKRNPTVSVQKSKAGTQTNYKDGTGYWKEAPKKKK